METITDNNQQYYHQQQQQQQQSNLQQYSYSFLTTKIDPNFAADVGSKNWRKILITSKGFSFILSLTILGIIITQIICEITVYNSTSNLIVQIIPRIVLYGLLLFLLIFYFYQVFTCPTFKYLNSKGINVNHFVTEIYRAQPIVTLKLKSKQKEPKVTVKNINKLQKEMTQKQITTTSNKKIKLEDKIVFSCPYQRDLSPLFL